MSVKEDEDIPPSDVGLAECRTCLQALDTNTVLVDLFQCWVPPWDGMESTIAEDLAKLANVQITQTDRYSKVICEPCCLKLQSACDFACSVRKNDRLLRQRYPPLPEEMDYCNKTVWPKPIQLEKNLDGTVYENSMDIEIKQEVVSEDEYANNTGIDDFREELATLEIKIEPEELMQPVPGQHEDNEQDLSSKDNQSYPILNGHAFQDTKEENQELTNGIDSKEEIPLIKEEPVSEEDDAETISSDLSLECMLCCKEFNSVTGLKAHVIAQHSYKSVKRKTANNSPEKTQRNLEFVCGTCRRRFTTSTDLMVHETCHNKSVCYACSAKFDSFEQLTRHSRRCKAIINKELLKPKTLEDVKRPIFQETTNHSDIKPTKEMLRCSLCNEEFTDRYYLTIHEEIYHSSGEQTMTNEEPISDIKMDTDNLKSVFGSDN
ncbi:zinc finger and BTB domain-containing protein 41-like isoform X2 [Battus philenor]